MRRLALLSALLTTVLYLAAGAGNAKDGTPPTTPELPSRVCQQLPHLFKHEHDAPAKAIVAGLQFNHIPLTPNELGGESVSVDTAAGHFTYGKFVGAGSLSIQNENAPEGWRDDDLQDNVLVLSQDNRIFVITEEVTSGCIPNAAETRCLYGRMKRLVWSLNGKTPHVLCAANAHLVDGVPHTP